MNNKIVSTREQFDAVKIAATDAAKAALSEAKYVLEGTLSGWNDVAFYSAREVYTAHHHPFRTGILIIGLQFGAAAVGNPAFRDAILNVPENTVQSAENIAIKIRDEAQSFMYRTVEGITHLRY